MDKVMTFDGRMAGLEKDSVEEGIPWKRILEDVRKQWAETGRCRTGEKAAFRGSFQVAGTIRRLWREIPGR